MSESTGRPLLTRRAALKAGVLGGAALAGSPFIGRVVAASGPLTSFDPGGEAQVDGVGTVEVVQGESLTARTGRGRVVSATLVGFPRGFAPRAGDLVAIDRSHNLRPLCAPVGGAPNVAGVARESTATAHPLCRWATGIPSLKGGAVFMGSIRLVPTPALVETATQGVRVNVCTLDSTLPDRQVLAVRTA